MVRSPLKVNIASHYWGFLPLSFLFWIVPAGSDTWRVGDAEHPWRLHPVSILLDAGESFKPDFIWGGNHAVEVVVDDDGDGLIDEDPVDRIDNDGDGVYNEDPEDGLDNDKDGLLDEDGPDAQLDNDGDGMLNEDGLMSGGVIYDHDLRKLYSEAPFGRHQTIEDAAADPLGPGYGWGDDDYDSRFNEDPIDGEDNDLDGLIDEDDAAPPVILPRSWTRPVYAYDVSQIEDIGKRQALVFEWDGTRSAYVAKQEGGGEVVATQDSRRFTPMDWIRPISLNEKRNLIRTIDDRFLSGIYGRRDPYAAEVLGTNLTGTPRTGDAGYGQIVDGSIFTARRLSQSTGTSGFKAELFGIYFIDLIRIRPRPDFPDRTPTSYRISYIGDKESNYQTRLVQGEITRRLVGGDFIIPLQVDQLLPPVKEFRFERDGEFGEPKKVQVLDFRSDTPSGVLWEAAEFEAYGHGHAMEASYVTEIIDVGQNQPAYRRYFDLEDPDRPVTFESVQTLDDDRDGRIQTEELSQSLLEDQFDIEADGQLVTWGKVRWRGEVEGRGGSVFVRLRVGTSPDTRVYQRKVGRGVYSPFINDPLVLNWPSRGSRVDAFSYVALSSLERARADLLPLNVPGDQDGMPGGWSPWSAPFSFEEGLVDQDGEGGVQIPIPTLSRYIQFRLDFESLEDSAVRVDYLEFEYGSPVVGRGVVAEIFPGNADLGVTESFEYVLRPDFNVGDAGFNRIDISMPAPTAEIESFKVDDQEWTNVGVVPAGDNALMGAKAWLDTIRLEADRSFASVVYFDSLDGLTKLGIKTSVMDESDFPRGQDREIQIRFRTSVFQMLTEFGSWVWNDNRLGNLAQSATPGNAADRLPLDQVRVTVIGADKALEVRNIGPNPFTPNGDAINDFVEFNVDVFLLIDEVTAELTIFDLSGRMVAQVAPSNVTAGELKLSWDGKGIDGALVSPGVYIYRLSIDSDTDKKKAVTGSIGVVY